MRPTSGIAGIERLLRRWSERAGVEPPDILATTRRIALETLPALGIIDLGGIVHDGGSAPKPAASSPPGPPAEEIAAASTTVRLTPRGRSLLASAKTTIDPTPSKFVDTHALRVGQSARIAHVLALAQFAELGRVGDQLDILLTPQAIARALSAGVESDGLRARIELVAPLPDTISRMLIQASAVIGRGSLVQASGFLWIDDPEVRELLRTRRPASELFLDPSPPGGLLVYPDVDMERVVRRCRALGIEVEVEAGIARARSHTTPPPGRDHRHPSRQHPSPQARQQPAAAPPHAPDAGRGSQAHQALATLGNARERSPTHPGERPRAFPDSPWGTPESVPRLTLGNARERSPTPDMRRFVIIGRRATSSADFSLANLPASSGRLDVLVRCLRAALLISHGLRRTTVVYLVLLGTPGAPRAIRVDGATARFLRPDERSLAVLVQKALAQPLQDADHEAFTTLRHGIAVAPGGLTAVLADLGPGARYLLQEGAPDLRDLPLDAPDPVFFVGDDLGFDDAARAALADAIPVSLGPVSVHAEDAIVLVANELDRRGPPRA